MEHHSQYSRRKSLRGGVGEEERGERFRAGQGEDVRSSASASSSCDGVGEVEGALRTPRARGAVVAHRLQAVVPVADRVVGAPRQPLRDRVHLWPSSATECTIVASSARLEARAPPSARPPPARRAAAAPRAAAAAAVGAAVVEARPPVADGVVGAAVGEHRRDLAPLAAVEGDGAADRVVLGRAPLLALRLRAPPPPPSAAAAASGAPADGGKPLVAALATTGTPVTVGIAPKGARAAGETRFCGRRTMPACPSCSPGAAAGAAARRFQSISSSYEPMPGLKPLSKAAASPGGESILQGVGVHRRGARRRRRERATRGTPRRPRRRAARKISCAPRTGSSPRVVGRAPAPRGAGRRRRRAGSSTRARGGPRWRRWCRAAMLSVPPRRSRRSCPRWACGRAARVRRAAREARCRRRRRPARGRARSTPRSPPSRRPTARATASRGDRLHEGDQRLVVQFVGGGDGERRFEPTGGSMGKPGAGMTSEVGRNGAEASSGPSCHKSRPQSRPPVDAMLLDRGPGI